MKPGKSNRKAFTLVEILIVICVISILFVVLISRVDFATDKARTTGAQNDLRTLQMAIHQVALEDGELVDDLDLLASRLNENLDSELMVHVENNELVSNAKDPWGSYYKISYSKPANSKGQAVVMSAGPDMKYSSTDDVGKTISCQVSASGMNVTVQDTLPSVPGGSLPVEPEEHICNFSKAVQTTEHIKTAGNCSLPVVYFYSCECGANGTATFTGPKDLNTHVSESTYNYNSLNEDQHTSVKVCSGCNTTLDTNTEMHSFSNNVCTKCGYNRHVHSYIVESATEANKATSATCSAAATYYYTCSCGAKSDTTFVSGNALPHNYSGRVTTDPTCTATGVRTYTCSTCSDSYSEVVEKTPHNYNKKIEDGHLASPATCKDYAKYYWSCVCGANSTNTFDGTVLSTTHTGDTETKYEYVNENTHKVSSVCKTCTAVIATSTNPHGNIVNNACSLCKGHMHSFTRHVMSDYTRVTEATCQAQATYRYSCADTNCDVLSDVSNVFAGGEKAKHQSTIGGTSDVHTKCSICGTTISATHDYTTTTTKDATCTESGTKKHTCTCGYSYTETINKLGHDIVSHAAKAATCTTNGYAAYDTCSRCNYTTYKEIVATGHKDINGGTSAIHTKCSKCGTTTSSKHNYSSKIIVAATCTSKGTTTYTCSCGYSYSAQDVAENASNHTGSTTYQYSNITVYTHTVTEYCGGCKVKLNKDSYEENHSKTETCKCGYIKYDMLNGSQQTVNIANNNDVTFRSEADYNDFKGLYIDNSLVDSSNYTVTEGSTIITLKAAYVSNMKDGEHTIDIASTDGMASTTFEVVDTKIYALSGKWQFNESINFSSDMQTFEYVTYHVNGVKYKAMEIFYIVNTLPSGSIAIDSESSIKYYEKDKQNATNGQTPYFGYCVYSYSLEKPTYGQMIWKDYETDSIIDFGSELQVVSEEFYTWFVSNATEGVSDIYALSGKWKFNNTIVPPDDYVYQEITFTYEGMIPTDSMVSIMCENDRSDDWILVHYGYIDTTLPDQPTYNTEVYCDHWYNTDHQVVNFGIDAQTVSQEFYEWFVANAYRTTGDVVVGFLHNEEQISDYEPFAFEIGMTWEEFVNSDYNKNLNTGETLFTIENGYVISLMQHRCPSSLNVTYVKSTDTMIYSGAYVEDYMNGCKVFHSNNWSDLCEKYGHSTLFEYNDRTYCTRCGCVIDGDVPEIPGPPTGEDVQTGNVMIGFLHDPDMTSERHPFAYIEGMTWNELINSEYNKDLETGETLFASNKGYVTTFITSNAPTAGMDAIRIAELIAVPGVYTFDTSTQYVGLDETRLNMCDNIGNHFGTFEYDDKEYCIACGKTLNSLITFTIDGTEYYAEEGMTWADFRRSGLNVEQGSPVTEDSPPLEYISDAIQVYNAGGLWIRYNGVQVVYGDIIVSGGTYISDNPNDY